MGRLTLNMLMSFAEFEREMIAERTRDKIAAARRKGKWTGGVAPLGYRIEASKLVVVEPEAHVVREVFALYHELRSVFAVMRELDARGRARRGGSWTKDGLAAHPPQPRLRAGRIRLGEETYPGEHEGIVPPGCLRRRADRDDPRAVPAAPQRNPDYLLRGILRCPEAAGRR